jgi:hypothetical protein
MNRTINRLKIIFIGIFLASIVGVFGYHYLWVWPKAKCEARGGAWAGKWLKCGTIYPIEQLTGRPANLPPINTDTTKMEGPSVRNQEKK